MKNSLLILTYLSLMPILSAQITYHSEFEAVAFSSNDPLQIISSSQPEVDQTKFNEIQVDLNDLLEKLQKKQKTYHNQEDFLEWAFYYVHRKKLGWYDTYVSFGDLFLNKKYDCLTGTILYSYLLEKLGYQFSIHELDYHIFILVHLDNKNILLEATDPIEGFINDKELIRERLDQFIADGNRSIDIKGIGEAEKDMQGTILVKEMVDLEKLAGLQYFNLAVKAYNQSDFSIAFSHILKAEKLYPCQRIYEVKDLLAGTL